LEENIQTMINQKKEEISFFLNEVKFCREELEQK